jgi:hypothetical protein
MKTEKVEYERQVAVAEKQIVELEALHVKLEEQRGCLNIDQLSEAKRIRMEQDEIRGKISDLKLLRDLAREQIAKWEKSAPAAGKLVKEVAAWYDETRIFVERIIESQAQVAGYLQEIDTRNNKIGPAEHKYKELTGESMEAPGRVVVYQALGFAGTNVERVKPWTAWTFISETQRRAAYAEEAEKEAAAERARIDLANKGAPVCECGSKMIVNVQAGRAGRGTHVDGDGKQFYYFICARPNCQMSQVATIAESKTKK